LIVVIVIVTVTFMAMANNQPVAHSTTMTVLQVFACLHNHKI